MIIIDLKNQQTSLINQELQQELANNQNNAMVLSAIKPTHTKATNS